MSLTANLSPCSGPCDVPSISTWVSRQKAPSRSLVTISFIELMEHSGTQINTEQCNSEVRLALLGFVWTVSNSGPLVKTDRGNHRVLAGSGTDENLVLRVLARMWLLAKNILFQSQSCSARRALRARGGALKLLIISVGAELVEANDII